MTATRHQSALLAVIVAFLVLVAPAAATAEKDDVNLERFFGQYVGRSISVQGEGLSDRDFDVNIAPYGKNGFKLDWTTVIRRTNGKTKQKSFSINFLPFRKRPGIFYSAMQVNIFGKQAPADPLSGEPYVWAGIEDDTLTVTALYITDDGGYELQVFKRTRTPKGMDTYFERVRNGEKMRIITGRLEKVTN